MRALLAALRLSAPAWAAAPRADATRRELCALSPYRAQLLLSEAAAALVAPAALLLLLPRRAEAMLAALRASTVAREGLGAVCAGGVFDAADRDGAPSPRPTAADGAQRSDDAAEDRLRASFISFREQHPLAEAPRVG